MDSPAHPPANPLASPEPWNLVADAYAGELVPEFEQYARDAIRLAALPHHPRVVDVATGPGTVALLLAATGARVSALDFSAVMIANLRRRAAAAGITTVEAHQGDGQALPFDSDAYDGAFSMFGLLFFPDRGRGFRELLRVLRPGGRAVVSSWAPFDGIFGLVMDSVRAMLPGFPFGNGKAPLGEPDEVSREMTEAGFRDVVVHTVTHPFRTDPTAAEFWASTQRTTAPIVLLRRKLGEEKWAEVGAGVLARLREALGDGPIAPTGTAYLGVGTK